MNPKLKHNPLLHPLALGLLLLGAGAASAATGTGSAAGDLDSRDYTLAVASARGTPVPAVGTSTNAWQSAVTCSVDSAVSEGSTNYTCTGWAGTGAIPATGATNNTGSSCSPTWFRRLHGSGRCKVTPAPSPSIPARTAALRGRTAARTTW